MAATPALPTSRTIVVMEDVLHSSTAPTDPRALDRDGRNLALQSRRTLGLTDLLSRRPELRGVGRSSEEIAESVLWSA